MQYKPTTLDPGKVYHIFNRGNNGGAIFFENANYPYFLKLYEKYITPIAETYAWCLMNNHLHVLVYIKTSDEINPESLHYSTIEKPKIVDASHQFSHLFNAYTQAVNKRYGRSGSIFEKPFRRKNIPSQDLIQQLILYIHLNPVLHDGFDEVATYQWSSYNSLLTDGPVTIKKQFVLALFDGKSQFVDFHKHEQNPAKITKFIIE